MRLESGQRWEESLAAGHPGHAGHDGHASHVGHAHCWERALAQSLTRGRFLQVAGASSAALGASLWLPAAAAAQGAPADPKPIPGGIQPGGPGTPTFHIFLPGSGAEPSTITDFNGSVALAEVSGSGTGTDTATGATTNLNWEADVRFIRGAYVGMDGRQYQGTFGFI